MRTLLASSMLCVLVVITPLHAHDQYRFVGTIVKVDAKRTFIEMRSREELDGKVGEYLRHISLTLDSRVMRGIKEVKRTELKVGQYVVVDALGVELTELSAVEIDIKAEAAPNRKSGDVHDANAPRRRPRASRRDGRCRTRARRVRLRRHTDEGRPLKEACDAEVQGERQGRDAGPHVDAED